MKNRYGWTTPPNDIVENYLDIVNYFLKDDEAFKNFKTHEHYSTILSGQDKVIGNLNLQLVERDPLVQHYFLKKIKKIKENDIVGNPAIHDYGKYTKLAADTVKYGYNSAFIKKEIGKRPVNKIVEIGSGYGGMCKILHDFIPFKEYVMIDLPPVVKLCEKYLNNFPALKNKVTYISSEDRQEIEKIQTIDIAIADSSMSECSSEVLDFYNTNVISKSKYAYIVYNTHHIAEQREWFSKFIDEKNASRDWLQSVHNLNNSGVFQISLMRKEYENEAKNI